jgi:hypothetical protein
LNIYEAKSDFGFTLNSIAIEIEAAVGRSMTDPAGAPARGGAPTPSSRTGADQPPRGKPR